MNSKELAEIEKLIEKEMEKTANTKPISPDEAIGRITRMDAINNKSVAEAALRSAVLKLNRLKDVFGKLQHSDFGICRKCGEQIPIQRILLVPQVPFCVHCAQ